MGVATFAWVRDISASEERTVSDSGGSKTSQQAETNYTKGNSKWKETEHFFVRKRERDRAVGGFFFLFVSTRRAECHFFGAEPVSDGCHYPTQWV